MAVSKILEDKVIGTLVLSLYAASEKLHEIFKSSSLYRRNDIIILIQDIHKILLFKKDLSPKNKIELCERQRAHMKSYLKEVILNLNINKRDMEFESKNISIKHQR